MKKIGFDNGKYLREQKAAILGRVAKFNNKLYLEFGGKLLYDYHAAPALILNAIKSLAGIPDKIHLLSSQIIDSIRNLKGAVLAARTVSLDLEATLIALAISAGTNPAALEAMETLRELKNCEMHMTHIPTAGDDAGLRKLGINCTSEPNFSTRNLLEF